MENIHEDKMNDMSERDRARFDLCAQADEILAKAGFTIWGKKSSEEQYQQSKFEQSMQLGAYSKNGAR